MTRDYLHADWLRGVGRRLRERRLALGMTQEGLSKWVAHEQTVARWERGELEPMARHIVELAETLRCTTDWLLLGQGPVDCL